MTARIVAVVLGLAVLLSGVGRPTALAAGDLVVMTSGAFTAAHLELAPAFERRDGDRVVTATTTMGTGDTSIEARLRRGEVADVVIADAGAIDGFAARGLVVAGSRTDLARSSIGMAVRRGSPRPDISTVEAFTRALLEAPSIAYSASVSGTYLSTEVFQQLGIADRVLPKSRRIEGERVGAVVARGDAAIGFQQMSELLPIAGLEIVGPLPPPLQRVTVFAGAVGATARNQDAARRYLAFLAAPAAAGTIAATGMEPVARRDQADVRVLDDAARAAGTTPRPGTRVPSPAVSAGS